MEKKITKVEMFNMIKEVVADRQDMVDFIDHEIELIQNKYANRTNKPSKANAENVKYLEQIKELLRENGAMRSQELAKAITPEGAEVFTPSKMSAILRLDLGTEKEPNPNAEIEKYTEKKVIFYRMK